MSATANIECFRGPADGAMVEVEGDLKQFVVVSDQFLHEYRMRKVLCADGHWKRELAYVGPLLRADQITPKRLKGGL